MLMLPLSELDGIVKEYDRKFPSVGKQMWRTPYGRIKIAVAIGAESVRSDHKPHLIVIFDPLPYPVLIHTYTLCSTILLHLN